MYETKQKKRNTWNPEDFAAHPESEAIFLKVHSEIVVISMSSVVRNSIIHTHALGFRGDTTAENEGLAFIKLDPSTY